MSIEIKSGLKYTNDDEWVQIEGDEALVGITDYAQDALSDIVFLELPAVGDSFDAGTDFGVVESVKAASDLLMPVDGEVIAVNEALLDTPEELNTNPYGSWLIRIKMSDPSQLDNLMDAAAYETYCAER